MLEIKRIYDEPAVSDGYRILVDRLWPRGLKKENAALDVWFKNIAPSPELRTWFGHEPEKFAEFRARYQEELRHNSQLAEFQKLLAQHPKVTLLYAAKDPKINHAIVLQDFLESAQ